MIKTMTIGPYTLKGSKILFMKKDPGDNIVHIYFDNYEFVLASNSITIRSLFNVCGRVDNIRDGQFYIFVIDGSNEVHNISSIEPDFADRIVGLFRAV